MKGAHPSIVGDKPGAAEMQEPWGVRSAELVAEQVEAYLFAVCRNVAFRDYGTGARTDDAASFDAIDSHDSITQWAADRLNETLTTVAGADSDINESMLADPTVYKSGIHFQFKYQLYHLGILTTGGTDEKDAVLSDMWRLEQPVGFS